jgi:hypothetical protein
MAATYTVGTDKTYATIQDAVDAIPGDLSGQGIQRVEVYAGGVAVGDGYEYREQVDALTGFSNWGSSDYIRFVAMVSHTGQRAKGIIIIPTPTGTSRFSCIELCPYTRLEGFCVTANGSHTGNFQGIRAYDASVARYVIIDSCIVYDLDATTFCYGMIIGGGSTVKNCAVLNITGGSSRNTGLYLYGITDDVLVYFTTVLNTEEFGFFGAGFGVTIKNCISADCTSSDFNLFSGTFTVTYSISSDATADDWGGSGNQINKDPDSDIKFTNTTAGSEDIHLQDADSVAYAAGVAVAGVTTDIDGDTRADPPCIGADEFVPTAIFFGNASIGFERHLEGPSIQVNGLKPIQLVSMGSRCD